MYWSETIKFPAQSSGRRTLAARTGPACGSTPHHSTAQHHSTALSAALHLFQGGVRGNLTKHCKRWSASQTLSHQDMRPSPERRNNLTNPTTRTERLGVLLYYSYTQPSYLNTAFQTSEEVTLYSKASNCSASSRPTGITALAVLTAFMS